MSSEENGGAVGNSRELLSLPTAQLAPLSKSAGPLRSGL